MSKTSVTGFLYQKKNHYYARLTYYVDGKRRTKDRATGIAVEVGSARKIKQAENKAQRKLNEFLAEFSAKGVYNQSPWLADTAQAWLDHQRGSKAPGTIAGYQYCVNDILLYFGNLHPTKTAELTPTQVEEYLNWERARRSPTYDGPHKRRAKYADSSGIENSVLHRFTALRSILQFAKREGIVTRNVASGRDSNINPPRPQRHVFCIFSMSEAKQLMLALKDEPLWFQIAVFLGLMFGLRRSEVLGLRAVDVDFENNSFNICFTITQQTVDGKNTLVARPFTKNRRIKNFSLDPADAQHTMDLIAELLCSHEENRIRFGADYDEAWSDFFMRYPDGKLVPPNALTNHFAKFVAKNGFKKIRFHDLRHTCASFLHANGVPLVTIQEIMGHAQLTTTISYLHELENAKSLALSQMHAQILDEGGNES